MTTTAPMKYIEKKNKTKKKLAQTYDGGDQTKNEATVGCYFLLYTHSKQ